MAEIADESRTHPAPFASLDYGPEPDVAWGSGGIDDYGWAEAADGGEVPLEPEAEA